MIRTYQAELAKLTRRRVMVTTAFMSIVFAVGGAAIVLATTKPMAELRPGDGRTPTIEALSGAGGGTEVFRLAASFAGTFLFVVFVGVTAAEFSRGTIRTMLLRQPRRVTLLAGKLAAVLSFAAVTLAATEVATWVAGRVLAPGAGVSTDAWTSMAAVGHALGDFALALLWVAGYAILGTTVGVLLRSVSVALAVGIAWAGPVEHLLQDAWAPAKRFFPGLLLEAVATGGTPDVAASRAVLTVAAYMVLAACIGCAVFARRDVTA
jgi:ABC-2 type transport system permease protein